MTPRWLPRLTLALALGAVLVSTYLAIAHFTSPSVLACSDSGAINCSRVTTSAQSRFLGVPVAVIGLGWSLAMAGLCWPAAWRTGARWVRPARLAVASAGVLFVLWLVYAELFVVRAICIWCTVVHVIAFALFALLVVYDWARG